MSDGAASLEGMIASLRALPREIEAATPEAADAVAAEVRAQIGRGTDAEGNAWKPRADGAQALQTAGNSLRVAAVGSTIWLRLSGHIARHHRGRVTGGTARPILPTTAKLPPRISAAIRDTLSKRFAATVGGGK